MTLDQPKNETHLLWMFILYHKEFGFEKIIDVRSHFPDIIAIRNNETVRIELEYKLSNLIYHYYDDYFRLIKPIKSLKDKCDIIFCWMKNVEIHEDIEVIALNEKLVKTAWPLSSGQHVAWG